MNTDLLLALFVCVCVYCLLLSHSPVWGVEWKTKPPRVFCFFLGEEDCRHQYLSPHPKDCFFASVWITLHLGKGYHKQTEKNATPTHYR